MLWFARLRGPGPVPSGIGVVFSRGVGAIDGVTWLKSALNISCALIPSEMGGSSKRPDTGLTEGTCGSKRHD